jgi:hypothetical protein
MFEEFKELLSIFNARKVRYLVVGGYAPESRPAGRNMIAQHGAPSFGAECWVGFHFVMSPSGAPEVLLPPCAKSWREDGAYGYTSIAVVPSKASSRLGC